MKWRVRKPGAKWHLRYRTLTNWHLWFAWYPVRVPTKGKMSKQHKVWLVKVQRKGTHPTCYEGAYWSWEYRENN